MSLKYEPCHKSVQYEPAVMQKSMSLEHEPSSELSLPIANQPTTRCSTRVLLECYVTNFATQKALNFDARGTFTFDERAILHRVAVQVVAENFFPTVP